MLQVLRPLLIDDESVVRQNVVQWVEAIRRTPNIDTQTEERLVAILSQLIEQKFKNLSYKELAEMLRLTPLEETISGQELIKDAHVAILTTQIQDKFRLSDVLVETIRADLNKLDAEALALLVRQILHLDTFEDLEQWIADHHPHTPA